MTATCVVVDYGSGNVFSVLQALKNLPVNVALSAEPAKIRQADFVILPGVGAFGKAAHRLRSAELVEPIHEFIATQRPFLGICVGMQLLFDTGSEFGNHAGLGLIPGSVDRIQATTHAGKPMRVPLIGWHPLSLPDENGSTWAGTPFAALGAEDAFYFVHSFAATVVDRSHLLAVTRHDGQEITAAVRKDNIVGTQFHPERSAGAGQAFLRAFLET